jgi:ribonuclease MRP protein subunit RMP1
MKNSFQNMSSNLHILPTENAIKELKNLYRITNAIYIRNKNQHRRSHWWMQFNLFRKHLRILTSSELVLQPASNETAEHSNTIFTHPSPLLRLAGHFRVANWIESLIPLWHAAFGQLLTERRFASIGVVLLAVLARTCWLVGATQALMERGKGELAGEMIAESKGLESEGGGLAAAREEILGEIEVLDEVADVGEVIERTQVQGLLNELDVTEAILESPSVDIVKRKGKKGEKLEKSAKKAKTATNKKKSSKRQIDDIFSVFDTID